MGNVAQTSSLGDRDWISEKHHALYTMTLDFLNANYNSHTLHLKSKETLHTIRNARQLEPTAANTMKLSVFCFFCKFPILQRKSQAQCI